MVHLRRLHKNYILLRKPFQLICVAHPAGWACENTPSVRLCIFLHAASDFLWRFRAAGDLPNLFSIIFGFPIIDYEVSYSDPITDGRLDERIVYTRIRGNNCDFTSSFTGEFVHSLDNHRRSHWRYYQDVLVKHIMDNQSQETLRNTVLVNEKWVGYGRMTKNVLENYSSGHGLQINHSLFSPEDDILKTILMQVGFILLHRILK